MKKTVTRARRAQALAIVDQAFAKCWNPHTTAQMDNNVRDVLYDVIEELLTLFSEKGDLKARASKGSSRG